ncbi:MFS family permease [Sphingopyxis panaciterrae]|uniref:MFS transporter n=1 Tax=Sphingopyxis panaciterrae TaxID=363841 RepID=UPI001421DD0F|nr:MFS transporter [Sphingopyxis panaciterrae]NIJ37558.1 MFS family permease [Sphingopyxis panaciterrae]
MEDSKQAAVEGKVSDFAWRSEAYAWGVVALLIVAFTFAMIDRMILTLLVGPLKADFLLSDTQISLLHGLAFTMLYVIVGLPMGWLIDRYSRRMIAGVSVAAWSLMTALCGVSGNFTQLFLARMGVGIGEAGISPAAHSMIADYFPSSRLSLPITLYSIGGSAGSGLALIFGGSIVDYVSRLGRVTVPLFGEIHAWQASFFVAGLPGLAVAAAFLFVKEPPRRGRLVEGDVRTVPISATIGLLREKSPFLIPQFCASAASALALLSTLAWMPTYLNRAYGLTPGEAGLGYGLAVLIGGISGLVASGWVANRLAAAGRRDASIIVALGCTLLAFIPAALAPVVPDVTASLLLSAVAVFGFASAIALAPAALPIVIPNEMRGQVYAAYLLTISVLGYAVGPVVVAVITDNFFGDDAMVGWSMASVALVAGPVAVLLWMRARKQFSRLIEN